MRFLIEVDHDAHVGACAKAAKLLLSSGSHFLTHADFGCNDGVHAAWIVVDVEGREAARAILPPGLRADARIVGLNKFSIEELDLLIAQHR